MERLTERRDDGSVVIATKCPEMCEYATCSMQEGYQCQHQCEGDIMQRLASYEDAEEQGLLLRLPCKVGDTVWDNDYGKPCAYRITGFSFGTADNYIDEPLKETELIFYYENPSGSITGSFVVSEIGKTVFLTREEAEKALADMGV